MALSNMAVINALGQKVLAPRHKELAPRHKEIQGRIGLYHPTSSYACLSLEALESHS